MDGRVWPLRVIHPLTPLADSHLLFLLLIVGSDLRKAASALFFALSRFAMNSGSPESEPVQRTVSRDSIWGGDACGTGQSLAQPVTRRPGEDLQLSAVRAVRETQAAAMPKEKEDSNFYC
jgi:hypothetical protein